MAYWSEGDTKSRLDDLDKQLASTPADDPKRPILLDALACAIADDHVECETKDVGQLPRAVQLAEEAHAALSSVSDTDEPASMPNPLSSSTDGDEVLSTSSLLGRVENTLMDLYWRKYQHTADPNDILASERYGHGAVQHLPPDTAPPGMLTFLKTRREALLGRTLKAKYEDGQIGGERSDLERALGIIGQATDASLPNDPEGPRRFTSFCNLLAHLTDVTKDGKYLDGSITLRTQQLENPSSQREEASIHNKIGLLWLLGKKYQLTKEDADLESLLERSREFLAEAEQSEETTKDEKEVWSFILQIANGRCEQPELCPAPKSPLYLSSLDTALFLHEAAVDRTPNTSLENIKFRSHVYGAAGEIADRKWKVTKLPEDGFRANELDSQSAKCNVLVQYLTQTGGDAKNLEETGGIYCIYYICRVTGEQVWVGPGDKVTRRPPGAPAPGSEDDESTVEADQQGEDADTR